MAFRVDLNKEALLGALQQAIASNNRAANNAKYPSLKPIIEEQTRLLQNAMNTITEIK